MSSIVTKRFLRGVLAGIFVASILAACASTGDSSGAGGGLVLGRIALRLQNFDKLDGSYTDGIIISVKNKETGASSSANLDHGGYFEFPGLAEGDYVLTALDVRDRVLPDTRGFNVPLNIDLSVKANRVNVVGQFTLTYDKKGTSKFEANRLVEDVKAAYSARNPGSPWLQKEWRSALSGG